MKPQRLGRASKPVYDDEDYYSSEESFENEYEALENDLYDDQDDEPYLGKRSKKTNQDDYYEEEWDDEDDFLENYTAKKPQMMTER